MKIIVEHGKHGTYYYDASTDKILAKSSLAILRRRAESGWYPEPTIYLGNDISEADNLTDEQITDLPSPELRILASKRRQRYLTLLGNHETALEQWQEIRRVIDEEDIRVKTVKWTDSKGNIRTRKEIPAWDILSERSDWEYEGVSIETVTQP